MQARFQYQILEQHGSRLAAPLARCLTENNLLEDRQTLDLRSATANVLRIAVQALFSEVTIELESTCFSYFLTSLSEPACLVAKRSSAEDMKPPEKHQVPTAAWSRHVFSRTTQKLAGIPRQV